VFFNNIYFRQEEFLPNHVCEEIKKYSINQISEEGTVYHGLDKKIRNSRVTWLNDRWIYNWFVKRIYEVNKDFWNVSLGGFESIEAIQFTKYSKNQFYGWHQDNGLDEENTRKLSAVIPLSDSDEYEGGDIQFYNHLAKPHKDDEEKIMTEDILRKKGTLIIFPSFTWHQVTRVTKGERMSIVVWFRGDRWQ